MMPRKTRSRSAFSVGTRDRFDLGGREVVAVITEDRGPIGVGGRQLLRVRLDWEELAEPLEFEIPAEQVERAA